MNHIYELATTVFRAETDDSQRLQHSLLKTEIEKRLIAKDDDSINESIYDAQIDGKLAVVRLIESLTQNLINFINYNDHEKDIHNLHSHLFLIPIITEANQEQTKLPALSVIETIVKENLSNYNLIPPNAEVIFAPILLGHKTSAQMTASKWYDLHQQTIINADKRHLRQIYSHDFFVTISSNFPTLSFLVGVVLEDNDKGEATIPNLFSKDSNIAENKENFTQTVQNALQERMPSLELLALNPDSILESLVSGYNFHQEILIESFIAGYVNNPHIDFALLSLNISDNFAIIVWNQEENRVLSYLLIEPYAVDMQTNVDKVMDYMAQTDKKVYVGNSIVSSDVLNNYADFNFQQYLHDEGANILQSQVEDNEFANFEENK